MPSGPSQMYPRRKVMGSVDTQEITVTFSVTMFQLSNILTTTASEKRSLAAQAPEQETNMTAHA